MNNTYIAGIGPCMVGTVFCYRDKEHAANNGGKMFLAAVNVSNHVNYIRRIPHIKSCDTFDEAKELIVNSFPEGVRPYITWLAPEANETVGRVIAEFGGQHG